MSALTLTVSGPSIFIAVLLSYLNDLENIKIENDWGTGKSTWS